MRAFLGLGSNLGDRRSYLKKAVRMLKERSGITMIQESGVYESEPWGELGQNKFLNQVIEIETSSRPEELLSQCQKIEAALGRERSVHWGPRTIDIDLLLLENVRIDSAHLKIPHPYLEQRNFVLIPLKEIAPNLVLPSGKVPSDYQEDEKIWRYRG
ncbi:2-amino-4-hydroxy-6-hydroxymethyldihydropteridine pyrophosphokinase [Syntrophobotulus glycolicus DSM 8271]|uniref:2-amino-4-hydroxy-6-hydroxymethyldihydropteridine diphosphokinase n=1 Tax=Syntrophobotulus glycolicus (strain DSM 8271 / FlGlyR) TaxID=645991 RepID=F0SWA2_SYNGF|nr:2-amino-4-hydroxy-6-hydroxymethyldihydropteridine diphosphokinase [Syntrophobotulus glycolicus]ADY54588.1 2-amino-4-hydroxy-6-hydroxymethyldihydropteridine pyrophosphokinase [Syntrophobotulus glycolicus DSM 8271]